MIKNGASFLDIRIFQDLLAPAHLEYWRSSFLTFPLSESNLLWLKGINFTISFEPSSISWSEMSNSNSELIRICCKGKSKLNMLNIYWINYYNFLFKFLIYYRLPYANIWKQYYWSEINDNRAFEFSHCLSNYCINPSKVNYK